MAVYTTGEYNFYFITKRKQTGELVRRNTTLETETPHHTETSHLTGQQYEASSGITIP